MLRARYVKRKIMIFEKIFLMQFSCHREDFRRKIYHIYLSIYLYIYLLLFIQASSFFGGAVAVLRQQISKLCDAINSNR